MSRFSARGRRPRWLVSLLAGCLVPAGCGASTHSPGSPAAGVKRGGSITIAAEDWPICLNPLTSCASDLPATWIVANQVLPRAMEIDRRGNYVASPLLTEEPSEANGGIKLTPKFTVTFRISNAAVWDDGSPITSKDFAFTWRAVTATKDQSPYTTPGYDHIESVDARLSKVAVVTFRDVFPDWRDLFGGASYLLKAAAFPKGPDLDKEMQTSIPFSGAPWKLASWSREQAVLVPNRRYWNKGRQPLLDKVTILRRDDHNAEFDDLLAGRIAAIYPTPSTLVAGALTSPDLRYTVGGGPSYEGIFFNLAKPPVDDVRVREAIAYFLDRQAIVNVVPGKVAPGVPVLDCGWQSTIDAWCDRRSFADVTYQPGRAQALLRQAGWSMGSDHQWTKSGRPLTIEWSTTAETGDRLTIEQLAAEQLRAAGIGVSIRNSPGGDLFGVRLPHGDFTIANYTEFAVGEDPANLEPLYRSDQIPQPANGFNGLNVSFWNSASVDDLIGQADRARANADRIKLFHAIDALVRQDMVWIPLYEDPTIMVWRTDQLNGPIDGAVSSYYGGFANLYQWSRR